MITPITTNSLERAGFVDTRSGILPPSALADHPLRDFKKGNLVIRLHGNDRIAWTWSGEKLGPVSTMEEVSILESVINNEPSDIITADHLRESGWRNDGFSRYFIGNIAINMQGYEDHFTVFTSVGLSKVVLGRVSTMSEVEALTAIAKRTTREE